MSNSSNMLLTQAQQSEFMEKIYGWIGLRRLTVGMIKPQGFWLAWRFNPHRCERWNSWLPPV
jgi:hypothetical protein